MVNEISYSELEQENIIKDEITLNIMRDAVKLEKELKELKLEIKRLKSILEEEDLELNERTKKKLAIARKTPLSEYIDHEDVEKLLNMYDIKLNRG